MNLPDHPEIIFMLEAGMKDKMKKHVEESDCDSCPNKKDCDIIKAVNGEFDETVEKFVEFKERTGLSILN